MIELILALMVQAQQKAKGKRTPASSHSSLRWLSAKRSCCMRPMRCIPNLAVSAIDARSRAELKK